MQTLVLIVIDITSRIDKCHNGTKCHQTTFDYL